VVVVENDNTRFGPGRLTLKVRGSGGMLVVLAWNGAAKNTPKSKKKTDLAQDNYSGNCAHRRSNPVYKSNRQQSQICQQPQALCPANGSRGWFPCQNEQNFPSFTFR
jgi:hypothetical protein